MSLHPEYQARVQAEIDEVLGDRIPTMADLDTLPYLTAAVLESLRWNPPVPTGKPPLAFACAILNAAIGVPHRVTMEDVFQGHTIPANTTIIVNIW